jgi:hypothetical protein
MAEGELESYRQSKPVLVVEPGVIVQTALRINIASLQLSKQQQTLSSMERSTSHAHRTLVAGYSTSTRLSHWQDSLAPVIREIRSLPIPAPHRVHYGCGDAGEVRNKKETGDSPGVRLFSGESYHETS